MNAWLLRAPWWQVTVVIGAVIGPFFVLLLRVGGDRSWPAAVLTGLAVTAVSSPVLGYATANQVRDSLEAGGTLSEHDRALVERAARRGPVPEADAARAAALRLVEHRLVVIDRSRVRARVTAVVLLAVVVVLALVQSSWWWIAVAACAGLLVLVLVTPGRLRRRAELLRGAR